MQTNTSMRVHQFMGLRESYIVCRHMCIYAGVCYHLHLLHTRDRFAIRLGHATLKWLLNRLTVTNSSVNTCSEQIKIKVKTEKLKLKIHCVAIVL